MLNYFDLMGLPTQFELDKPQLQARLRELQSRYHPDSLNQIDTSSQVATDSLLKNLTAEQRSAVINEAYQTLLSPDSRAKHLLQLQGIEQSINQPIRDLAFLDQAMDFRIALEAATIMQLPVLRKQLAAWIDTFSSDFNDHYQKLLAGLPLTLPTLNDALLNILQKLQFLVKLSKDLDKHHDELAQHASDDNDLYV